MLATRALGAEGAGVFLLAVAAFTILTTLARLGADVGLVRFVSASLAADQPAEVRPALTIAALPVVAAGVVSGALLLAFAGPLAGLLSGGGGRGALAACFRVLAPFVPVAALQGVLITATRGFGTMRPAVLIEKIGRPLVQVAGVAVAVALGAGPAWLALAWAGSYLVALIPGVRALRRLLPAGPGGQRGDLTRRFWSFTGPRGMAATFQVGLLWSNTLLLGALGSTRDAAVYGAASRYLLVGQFVQLAVVDVVQPTISAALVSGARGDAQRVYQTGTTWQMALAWPAYALLAVFAPTFLALFGPEYAAGAPALAILCLAMLVATGCGPVDAVLLMAGRSSLSLVNTAVALGLNLGLGLVLIPRAGITGAALAWLVALSFRNLAPLVQVRRLLDLRPFGLGWPVVAIAAPALFGGVALAVRQLVGSGVLGLVAALLLAATAYAMVLWRYRAAVELRALTAALRRRGRAGVTSRW